jgi:hypothetical protein
MENVVRRLVVVCEVLKEKRDSMSPELPDVTL